LLEEADELRLVLKLGCEALLSSDGDRLARIGSCEEDEEGEWACSLNDGEDMSKRLSVEKLRT
jgi:hypothetical protein